MSRITQKGQGSPFALQSTGKFQESNDSSLATLVGSRWDLEDGRELILVKAGASALVAGKLYQAPAVVANHQNVAVTAFTAYSANGNVPAKVIVQLGATAATANQYAGGYVVVNDGTGEGQTLQIASNPAADASATLELTLADAPNTALVAGTEVCLVANPYKAVIITDHTALGQTIGAALYPVTAAYYGFILAKGTIALLSDASEAAAGVAIGTSTATDGAHMEATANTNVQTSNIIGFAIQAAVSTEYRPVFLNL